MRVLWIVLVFCCLAVGCDDNIEFNSPAFQANSNGTLWKSKTREATQNNGVLKVTGVFNKETVTLKISEPVIGNFDLGVVSESEATFQNSDGIVFSTLYSAVADPVNFPGQGEIIITDFTTEYVSGSFWFMAYEPNGVESVNFSEGVFYRVPLN